VADPGNDRGPRAGTQGPDHGRTTTSMMHRTPDDARRDALAEAARGAGLRLSKLADRLAVRAVDVPLAAEVLGQVVADLARALAREVGR